MNLTAFALILLFCSGRISVLKAAAETAESMEEDTQWTQANGEWEEVDRITGFSDESAGTGEAMEWPGTAEAVEMVDEVATTEVTGAENVASISADNGGAQVQQSHRTDSSINTTKTIRSISCGPCECLDSTMDCSSRKIPAFYWKSTASNITKLDLTRNNLADLAPSVFEKLPNLSHLLISNNDITTVDASAFQGLSFLDTLDLSKNTIVTLPSLVFSRLPMLRKLYMQLNRLNDASFLSHIRNCSLQFVQLTGNAFTSLPMRMFGYCTAMKEAWLNGNRISEIDEDSFAGLPHLTTLDLSSNRLSKIPLTVFHPLKSLKVLDLSHNQLSSIDGRLFETLSSLRSIYLSVNWLRVIPARVFSSCTALQRADLSENIIEMIEDNAFASPTQLDSSPKKGIHSKCAKVSHSTTNIPIQYLDLSHNHLRKIPVGLFMSFPEIEELNLESNLVTTFGTEIVCLAAHLRNKLLFEGNNLVCTCGSLHDAFRLAERIAPQFQPQCLHTGESWSALKSLKCHGKKPPSKSTAAAALQARSLASTPARDPPPPRSSQPAPSGDRGIQAAVIAPILAVAFVCSLAAMAISVFRRYRRASFELPPSDALRMTRFARPPVFHGDHVTSATDVSRL